MYRGLLLSMTNLHIIYHDCHSETSRYWANIVFALNDTVTLTFDLVTLKYIGDVYWVWLIFLQSTMTVTHKLFKIMGGHFFASNATVTLTFDLLTSTFISVICLHWKLFLPSRITVTYTLFKIFSRQGVCIKCYCDLDLMTSKCIGVIYWPWPICFPFYPFNIPTK